jgi:hypothetical protein
MASKAAPKPKKPPTPKPPVEERKVIHPHPRYEIKVGADAITSAWAKDKLGWDEETDDHKLGKEAHPVLKALFGRKVRLLNNVTNRPIYPDIVKRLAQEHLQKRWRYNGEPVIIGKTATILNGQHSLLSVIYAEMVRVEQPHWTDGNWPTEITMEKAVSYGVEETDDVVNTMDTCKPRSLADVIYRSRFFAKMKEGMRRAVSRSTDHAIRFLWSRTGAIDDQFAPRRTHAESVNFIERHERLLRAVKHVHEEEKDDSISKFLSLGYAAAMLYLMGSCRTDGNAYRHADPPSEKEIDWEEWERACEFWVAFADREAKEMQPVRHALAMLDDPETLGRGSVAEKSGVLVKAWNLFVKREAIEEADLKLKYKKDQDDIRHYDESPVVGGIDLGTSRRKEREEEEDKSFETTEEAQAREKREAAKQELTKRWENKVQSGSPPPRPAGAPAAATAPPGVPSGPRPAPRPSQPSAGPPSSSSAQGGAGPAASAPAPPAQRTTQDNGTPPAGRKKAPPRPKSKK